MTDPDVSYALDQFGEWSQAGCMLTLNGGGRWRCEVPEEDWPQDPEIVDAIKRDFEGRWADRRQGEVDVTRVCKSKHTHG